MEFGFGFGGEEPLDAVVEGRGDFGVGGGAIGCGVAFDVDACRDAGIAKGER